MKTKLELKKLLLLKGNARDLCSLNQRNLRLTLLSFLLQVIEAKLLGSEMTIPRRSILERLTHATSATRLSPSILPSSHTSWNTPARRNTGVITATKHFSVLAVWKYTCASTRAIVLLNAGNARGSLAIHQTSTSTSDGTQSRKRRIQGRPHCPASPKTALLLMTRQKNSLK